MTLHCLGAWRRTLPLLGALAVVVAGVATPALAQSIPGLSSLGAGKAAPAASAPTVGDWEERLEAARADHRALLELPVGSEPLVEERQLASVRRLVLLTARVDAAKAREASAKALESPTSQAPRLAGPPPYSLLDVDALRDQLDLLATQQSALQLAEKSMDAAVESTLEARVKADANLRLLREQVLRDRQPGATDRLRAQLQLAELQSQVAELEVIQGDELRRRTRERLESLSAPIEQLRAEIDRTSSHLRFDERELAEVLKGIESERKKLTVESARQAERLVRRKLASPQGAAWQPRVVEAISQATQMFGEAEGLLRGHETLWRMRQQAVAGKSDASQRQSLAVRYARALDGLRDQRDRLAGEQRLLRAELHSQQAVVAALAADDPNRAGEQQILDALLLQSAAQDRLRDTVEQTDVLVQRTGIDLGLSRKPADFGEWLAHGWATLVGWAGTVWNFELFSASETTQIDGRVITVDHGVTVGKSVGVLVMLGLGYWAAGRLSTLSIALIGKRVPLSVHLAGVLRRWVNSILLLVVLLLVLKMARIPLTAFAFLGGALAIGVGFGAQNVIKNLISGVIILFERKIRVGDIVSIGGVSGTVVTVDLRATTVRGFDGIDAIVPNSNLLENQISNWSGGSPDVRRTVAVAVQYGSDVRRACELIAEAARADVSVLRDPAPEVLFEDFGADDLKLRLYYWIRLGGPRSGPRVDSDLRFAIAEALAAAGIGMAFPQRDVHLDTAAPLRVELSRAPPAAAG